MPSKSILYHLGSRSSCGSTSHHAAKAAESTCGSTLGTSLTCGSTLRTSLACRSTLGTSLTCTGSALRTSLATGRSTAAESAKATTAACAGSLGLYDNLVTGLGQSLDIGCKLTLEILLGQLSSNIAVCEYII